VIFVVYVNVSSLQMANKEGSEQQGSDSGFGEGKLIEPANET